MFERVLVGNPPLVIPLEDGCSVKIVVPKPLNCQYNLCLKDLPPVTFLHIRQLQAFNCPSLATPLLQIFINLNNQTSCVDYISIIQIPPKWKWKTA